MKCDQKAIKTFPEILYQIDFDLNIRGCILGEAQLK